MHQWMNDHTSKWINERMKQIFKTRHKGRVHLGTMEVLSMRGKANCVSDK